MKCLKVNLYCSEPNLTFSSLLSNSPEKPESVTINVEDSPVVKYVDAETSL